MFGNKLNALRLCALSLSLTAAFIVVMQRATAQNQTPAVAIQERTVEQVYKNIQVLKGVPESQLIPMMNYMSASLGVRCQYCHVNKEGNWDYAADEKGEKKSAREMITMVAGINKNNFKGNAEVSCYTCHRGRTSVAHTLTVPLPTPEPPRQQSQGQQPREQLPTAEQVLDKYSQALGGPAAIEKLNSRVMKGTITTQAGVELGYELSQSGPDLVLAVINTPQAGVFERGFNGKVGWEKSDHGIRELTNEELGYLRRYPDLFKDIKLKDQFSRISVAGKTKINSRDAYVLRATTAAGKREQLFFDVETGLLVRRATNMTTLVGNIPEQVDFEDYREVDGMKLPFTIRVAAVDPTFSIVRKFSEIKLNVPVDPKRFNKPS